MQRESIRSYADVFDRDWRMWSVPNGDGGRKPLADLGFPHGLPLRSVGYFAAIFAVVFVLRRLPLLGVALGVVPWPIAYVAAPVVFALVLTRMAPYGRPALRFLATWVTHRVSAKTTSAGRPIRREGVVAVNDRVTVIATSRDSTRLRRCDVRGPATVTFHDPVLVREGRRRHRARAGTPGAPPERLADVVELDEGERLAVRP